jgi:malto-oligosyltrehalose trehalohydrolase
MNERRHGPRLLPDGGARFALWAPGAGSVDLLLEGVARPMASVGDGWFEVEAPEARPGARYNFRLPNGLVVPDPASRFQPEDVHGPSALTDTSAFGWTDQAWRGRPWQTTVLYELHIGASTPEGTFRAAIDKLDHLAALGVTAIEIMPVADFPGARNWGYDGVLPYAPDATYGRPEDLAALVDAAHARDLMVILDVVYNHFGPDGNYLPTYAPAVFTDRHQTPWGDAVNFDGPGSAAVRALVIDNALYWLGDYHLDGLRLDAVHAILDDGPVHILEELAQSARAAFPDRTVHLILENEDNGARLLDRPPGCPPRLYTAQWNDDVHHALHVAATGEDQGYYADYLRDTGKLGRALAEGFAFQGEVMRYRGGPRGEPCAYLPPDAFVAFLQNHDQIGNRALGERIDALADPRAVRAAQAVYLLLPQIPMLFMGEEWGATQPFPFFCDFPGALGDAVREGRRCEFARFPAFQDAALRARIPDPGALETFLSAKLDWSEPEGAPHAARLDWTRAILARRRDVITPRIAMIGGRSATFEAIGQSAVSVSWRAGQASLRLDANLSPHAVAGFPEALDGVFWSEGEAGADGVFGPWTVRWSLAEGR